MSDPAPRLAPRSAGALADLELLRVARTELAEPESEASMRLADRIRGLALFRATKPSSEDTAGPVRLDRR
ncbi:MAG TPA: hypothetical protein VFY23_10420 [Candidatus Limnocylindrales bacterium]|nr:hypothetical protein [Candidatus Limnocylindrales bacterium]